MASTEKLIIELDAKTQQLEAALERVEGDLTAVTAGTDKADKGFFNMSKAGDIASASITAVATAATAASAAIAVASAQAAEYAKELSIASNRSKESVESLQAIAFATKSVGVDLEKLGDISKDTLEKVGDFLNTGGGGFMDFVDTLGLTEQAAAETAARFAEMSGPDVLQEMVRMMEEADISASQMSHALEGMASDTTDLIPLLSDGAAELNRMKEEFQEIGVTLTQVDIDRLKKMGEELEGLGVTAQTTSAKVVSILSEDLMGVGSVMTDATKLVGELVISAVTGYQAIVSEAIAGIANIGREAEITFVELRQAWNDLMGDVEESEALEKQLEILKQVDETMSAFDTEFTTEAWDARTEKLNEFAEAAKGVADEELEQIEERNEVKVQLQQDLSDKLEAIEEKSDSKELKRAEKLEKQKAKIARKEEIEQRRLNKQKQKSDDDYYQAASTIGNLLFEDNKAFQIANVVVDTARGIARQFADLPFPAAIASSAVVAATGIAQIAAIGSSSKGSSGGGGGVSAPSISSAAPTQEIEETETVDISGSVTSGGTSTGASGSISFSANDSDDLTTVMVNEINRKIENGEISLNQA